MKRFTLTCLLSLCVVAMAMAVTKSQVVVYINGQKYYIHTVEPKETIYSIAKTYEVSEQTIIDLNSETLKAGDNIKIPFPQSSQPAQEELGGWKSMRTFSKHKIARGETLYSISRLYEISIDVIIEDNPSIDPIALPEGGRLLIRKKMKGKSSRAESEEQWSDYKSDLNLVAESDGFIYHIVEKGETIYSLAHQCGMSAKEFSELNNLSGGLKAGAIVKMPIDTDDVLSDQVTEEEAEPIEQIGLRSLRSNEKLKVALLLPLSQRNRPSRHFTEFYRGFKAGLDSVKTRTNRDIELMVYNTERNEKKVQAIIDSQEFEGTNLIVGPIYEEMLPAVIEYAEQRHIPVVSPLATIKESSSSVLFQMAPPTDNRYSKVEEMLGEKRHVTLIYTEQTDSLFEQSIMALLGDRPYDTHVYEYANPTEVAELMKDEEEESAGDLSKFINNGKENTIVVMSSSETDVDRVLSALSSAQINIVARGGKNPKYEVLGNSEWNRYKNIDRTILFKNSVVLVSSYHAKRDNITVRRFDSSYIEAYEAVPTLYTYRGYDAAIIFGEGIYSDMDYMLQGRKYTPLQSHYYFEIDPKSGIHTNTEWIRVNYKTNYNIIIE